MNNLLDKTKITSFVKRKKFNKTILPLLILVYVIFLSLAQNEVVKMLSLLFYSPNIFPNG